jgi:ArsR family transcriptional regulator, lead/cadmium/zinc/bismuth-responsive transcriptional repressor
MANDRCDLLCLDLARAEELRTNRLSIAISEGLAAQARALSDPTRLQIAYALRDGNELCVCDLAWIVERSDALVSHHLRQLRTAGLVASRRDGKMVMYRLLAEGVDLLHALAPTATTVIA